MEKVIEKERVRPVAGVNKELRRVPLWWEHPIDDQGRPKQLLSRESLDGFEEYLEPGEELTDEYIAENFMPDFSGVPEEEMGLGVYWGEGQPASPTFPDTPKGREELLEHAAENISTWAGKFYTDAEGWRHILFIRDCWLVDMNTGEPIPSPSAAQKAARWQIAFALSDSPKSPSEAVAQAR